MDLTFDVPDSPPSPYIIPVSAPFASQAFEALPSPIPIVEAEPMRKFAPSRRSNTARKSVPGVGVTAGNVDGPVDTSTLKLDVERIRFTWNAQENRYESSADNENSNEANDETPQYIPKYAFAIARTFTPTGDPKVFQVTKKIHAWSPYFLQGARAVLEEYASIAWGTKPLQLDPEEMLKFLPLFDDHVQLLEEQDGVANSDNAKVIVQLRFFVELLRREYASKLEKLASLLAENQITFDLLWGAFIPGSTLVTHCGTTGEPLMLRLISCKKVQTMCGPQWTLQCDNVEVDGTGLPGRGHHSVSISEFPGAEDIVDLPAFPLEPYMEESRRLELREALGRRGRRYWELAQNWCHKEYDAVAYSVDDARKIAIKSRIMLDRGKFAQYARGSTPTYADRDLDGNSILRKALSNKGAVRRLDITEEEYMLMPAKLYGFGLADRKWLIVNVEQVKDIQWNMAAFDHLDINADKKDIVKTLILSHTQKASEFDDFVQGKGRGLIFALHGPPGVGKTLTAEATSEVARAPLYMVGAGDLGTDAHSLDTALTTVLSLASSWKAIVLIDEADVFLEKRDLHDLLRNAMVAVFLRQLEYYTGILILTTNRLSIIDGAMKSRIHISLHYDPLTVEVRRRLWTAFLQKAGLHDEAYKTDEEQMDQLCQKDLNGREIKNVIKTATTYAAYHGRPVDVKDILRVVNITDDMAEVGPL